NLKLDGTTSQYGIRVFGTSHSIIFDGLEINDYFPAWLTWQDVKEVYTSTMMDYGLYIHADTHDITVKNSSFKNLHDAIDILYTGYNYSIYNNEFSDIQDDSVQLGSATYEVDIHHNRMIRVGTGVSRQGVTDASGNPVDNPQPGKKYIHHNIIDASKEKLFYRKLADGTYSSVNADADGYYCLRAFTGHSVENIGTDGDPRYIYNNTILIGDTAGGLGVDLVGQPYRSSDPYQKVVNNIFIQAAPSDGAIMSGGVVWDHTLELDGNLHYRMDTSSAAALYRSLTTAPGTVQTFYTFADLVNGTDWEDNGVYADPDLSGYRPRTPLALGGVEPVKCDGTTLLPGADGIYRGALPFGVTADMAGHWRLNETGGTSAADASGNDNTGTLYGDAAWSTAGRVGGAVSLDGNGDYVQIPNSAGLNLSDSDITLAAWIKVTGTTGTHTIIGKGNPQDTNGKGFAFYYNADADELRLKLNNGSGATQYLHLSCGDITGAWHHVTLTMDRDGQAVFYVDGTSIGGGDISPKNGGDLGNGAVMIGKWGGSTIYYTGLADDVRIYRTALGGTQVISVMHAGTN
ncbi:MAG: LamG domain-containing protein, partial [bacterium]|nr:LamG domain-containing protein [bacterium]